MPSNPIVATELTWVSVDRAAGLAGVSRATVDRACKAGRVPVRQDGRRRLVPLETVLRATTGTDIDALRRRLDRAATLTGAPPAVREWADTLSAIINPILDRLEDAERRAAIAEAKLELLRSNAGSTS